MADIKNGYHEIYFGKVKGKSGYHLLVDGSEYIPPSCAFYPPVKLPIVNRRRFLSLTLRVKGIGSIKTVEVAT